MHCPCKRPWLLHGSSAACVLCQGLEMQHSNWLPHSNADSGHCPKTNTPPGPGCQGLPIGIAMTFPWNFCSSVISHDTLKAPEVCKCGNNNLTGAINKNTITGTYNSDSSHYRNNRRRRNLHLVQPPNSDENDDDDDDDVKMSYIMGTVIVTTLMHMLRQRFKSSSTRVV
jgi:hypothetical protein